MVDWDELAEDHLGFGLLVVLLAHQACGWWAEEAVFAVLLLYLNQGLASEPLVSHRLDLGQAELFVLVDHLILDRIHGVYLQVHGFRALAKGLLGRDRHPLYS